MDGVELLHERPRVLRDEVRRQAGNKPPHRLARCDKHAGGVTWVFNADMLAAHRKRGARNSLILRLHAACSTRRAEGGCHFMRDLWRVRM